MRWVLLEVISPDSPYPFSHIFQVCAIWFDVLLFVCAIMLVLLWLCRVDPPKCRSVTIIRNRPCADLLDRSWSVQSLSDGRRCLGLTLRCLPRRYVGSNRESKCCWPVSMAGTGKVVTELYCLIGTVQYSVVFLFRTVLVFGWALRICEVGRSTRRNEA